MWSCRRIVPPPSKPLRASPLYSFKNQDNRQDSRPSLHTNLPSALAGLKPFSAPNVLAFGAELEELGPQTISAIYDDSVTEYFNFKSFYFGYVLNSEEDMASDPMSCSIDVIGTRNGAQVASQTATFTAVGLAANMVEVTVNSGFENVDTVSFATDGSLTSDLAAVLFDDLVYDAYLQEGKNY